MVSDAHYVVNATLKGVQDVFNVENLWKRVRRGNQGEFLMEALTKHLRTRKSRHHVETCFYHVIVRIPEEDYVYDWRAHAGSCRESLIDDLVSCHIKHLQDYVPEGQNIRYWVEADRTLSTGQVQFIFGRAIYLPDEQEQPVFRLFQRTLEGERQELGIIYPGQRLTLLNGDACASTFPLSDWSFSGGESILLILESDQTVEVCAEPHDSLDIRPVGDGMYQVRDHLGADFYLSLEPWASVPDEQSVENQTWIPEAAGSLAAVGATCLQVVGVTLPCLSLYKGLAGWRIGFLENGALVGCEHPDTIVWLQANRDNKIIGETQDLSVSLIPPEHWLPFANWSLDLVAIPDSMMDRYCGWVRLPQPVPLPVTAERWLCFGRTGEADLAPALLTHPDTLIWDEPPHIAVRPEQLGLARRHLNLWMDNDGWTVRLESNKLPVYRLNSEGELLQTLMPGESHEDVQVEQGELLVVGMYVLGVR